MKRYAVAPLIRSAVLTVIQIMVITHDFHNLKMMVFLFIHIE